MIKIYIINLKSEYIKFNKLNTKLIDKGFTDINRFDAINGKNITNLEPYKKYMKWFFPYFAPYGLIGCGLSHFNLIDQIYNDYKDISGISDKYFLILEDDVIPYCNHKIIDDIIKRMPSNTDILLLNTFDIFKKNLIEEFNHKQSFCTDPACAYLVRYSAIPIILEKKLWFHHDFITFNNYKLLNIYKYNKNLFETEYNESHNINTNLYNNWFYKFFVYLCKIFKINNYAFFLLFKILRIPGTNYELSAFSIINFFIILILFSFTFFY
jgi:GR25 family glycosyltransferase involved in LPS biosynthesis